MWIEEVTLENVKCFHSQTIKLGDKDGPYPWVTFLGENGTGKTTVLQALGLLLAGRETATKLGFEPNGWLKLGTIPKNYATITLKFHQSNCDEQPKNPNVSLFFERPLQFTFSNWITGKGTTIIGKRPFGEYSIISPEQVNGGNLSVAWILQSSILAPMIAGWFSTGYGAFRRLAKEGVFGSKRPEFDRKESFRSLFNENIPIGSIEPWLMYLDHIILKNKDPQDQKHLALTKSAINSLLPEGHTIEGAYIDGKVWFNTPQGRVPSIALSDGYRSILALAGDLIWRMIQAFPNSDKPLEEQGVVLIDEIDIHLHPKWQRTIAGVLRKTFPNIQFIVATHSPIVAAGAGSDAVTYGFYQEGDQTMVERIDHLWAKSVDDILTSKAFGLVSQFSPETQEKIDTYLHLKDKKKRTKQEENQYQLTIPFVREALGPGMEKTELELEIDAYIKDHFK